MKTISYYENSHLRSSTMGWVLFRCVKATQRRLLCVSQIALSAKLPRSLGAAASQTAAAKKQDSSLRLLIPDPTILYLKLQRKNIKYQQPAQPKTTVHLPYLSAHQATNQTKARLKSTSERHQRPTLSLLRHIPNHQAGCHCFGGRVTAPAKAAAPQSGWIWGKGGGRLRHVQERVERVNKTKKNDRGAHKPDQTKTEQNRAEPKARTTGLVKKAKLFSRAPSNTSRNTQ